MSSYMYMYMPGSFMLGTGSFNMLGGGCLALEGSSVTKAYRTNYKMYGVKQFPSASSV